MKQRLEDRMEEAANHLLSDPIANRGDTQRAELRLIFRNEFAAQRERLSFKDAGGTTKWHLNHLSGGLNFTESGVADNRLFLQPGGNVGIGSDAPAARLDVVQPWVAGVENSVFKVGVLEGSIYRQMFEVFTRTTPFTGFGSIRLNGPEAFKVGGGSWAVESDVRLKGTAQ